MLIGIPRILSPQLMRIMMEMGHGDELVIADGNFPAHSIANHCQSGEVVHCDTAGVAELLSAVLRLMPLDYAVDSPVIGMSAPQGVDPPPIHDRVRDVLAANHYGPEKLAFLPRFDFYDRARKSYAVVITGETARFANLIVKKGVVADPICVEE